MTRRFWSFLAPSRSHRQSKTSQKVWQGSDSFVSDAQRFFKLQELNPEAAKRLETLLQHSPETAFRVLALVDSLIIQEQSDEAPPPVISPQDRLLTPPPSSQRRQHEALASRSPAQESSPCACDDFATPPPQLSRHYPRRSLFNTEQTLEPLPATPPSPEMPLRSPEMHSPEMHSPAMHSPEMPSECSRVAASDDFRQNVRKCHPHAPWADLCLISALGEFSQDAAFHSGEIASHLPILEEPEVAYATPPEPQTAMNSFVDPRATVPTPRQNLSSLNTAALHDFDVGSKSPLPSVRDLLPLRSTLRALR